MGRAILAGWAATVLVGAAVGAGEAPAPAAGASARSKSEAAFARLKGLAGTWKVEAEGMESTIIFRVTANGSVVQETMFPGTDHEMISMYHMDGPDLLMTHFCAGGNQPRLRFDPAASDDRTLVLAFRDGTNFDPAKDRHMHSGRVTIEADDLVVGEWDCFDAGAKVVTARFTLRK